MSKRAVQRRWIEQLQLVHVLSRIHIVSHRCGVVRRCEWQLRLVPPRKILRWRVVNSSALHVLARLCVNDAGQRSVHGDDGDVRSLRGAGLVHRRKRATARCRCSDSKHDGQSVAISRGNFHAMYLRPRLCIRVCTCYIVFRLERDMRSVPCWLLLSGK